MKFLFKKKLRRKYKIEISPGELLDRYSILDIKLHNLYATKLKAVLKEIKTIEKEVFYLLQDKTIVELYRDLLEVNQKLWDIEDKLRQLEKRKQFNEVFVQLARQVYLLNDQRYIIKNKINISLDSNLFEMKSYVGE